MRGLREQTHEHANRLHAIRGLLALGAPEEALQFLEQLETAHHVAYGRISGAIEQHVVAGLLLAETAIAQQRGIQLEIDDASRLERAAAAPDRRRRGHDHRQPAGERLRRRRGPEHA